MNALPWCIVELLPGNQKNNYGNMESIIDHRVGDNNDFYELAICQIVDFKQLQTDGLMDLSYFL